jgi:hypothetical protein
MSYSLVLLLGAFTACRDEGGEQPPEYRENMLSSEDSIQLALERQAVIDYSALSLELRVPSPVGYGQPVPLTLLVRNTSTRPVWLETGDRNYAFNFSIAPAEDEAIWNRLNSLRDPRLAILKMNAIAPGDSMQFQDTWDQHDDRGKQVAPGTYVVRGALNTQQDRSDRFDMTAESKTFTITPL